MARTTDSGPPIDPPVEAAEPVEAAAPIDLPSEAAPSVNVSPAAPTQEDAMSDGNDEFPVPYQRFAVTLQHTADAIWLGLLQAEHGRENHKLSEWTALLDGYRHQPAHPDDPAFKG